MTEELKRLSDLIWDLQVKLRKHFGVQEVLIGGASSIAILDHVWHREPLSLRDIDIYLVRGEAVDKAYAEAVAKAIESDRLGKLAVAGVTRHIRGNPSLPFPECNQYLSGWGFDLIHAGHTIDVTLYHSDTEISLNGIFSFDMVKLQLLTDQSLVDRATSELRRNAYEVLLAKGVIRDPQGGYADWRKRLPKVVNWYEIDRDCVLSSVRVIRSLGKIGCENVPPEIVRYLRPRLERRPEYDASRFETALARMRKDPWAIAETRMLKQVGTLPNYW